MTIRIVQIATIKDWLPDLDAVNTSAKPDLVTKLSLKTDIALYNRNKDKATPERTDFTQMELWMEFKTNGKGAAFRDPSDDTDVQRFIEDGSFTPDTDEGKEARGQLACYAGAHHALQFRHFSFSIVVHGEHARFLRWDPSGTVVTAAFNYLTKPELMADFLWRFNHLSPKERGHDISIQPAVLSTEDASCVREILEQDGDVPLYRYEVPGLIGKGYAYGPRPATENWSLVSRCTRNLPVVWIPSEGTNKSLGSCEGSSPESPSKDNTDQPIGADKVKEDPWSERRHAYMKDTWRFLSDSPDVEVLPEHKIYEILRKHGTPNIPEHVTGDDVEGGQTRTPEFLEAAWLCVRPRISSYQHYRHLNSIVGRALTSFGCTKQLVAVVLDALRGTFIVTACKP